MEGSYDYNKWISTYEIYWEDKSLIPVVAAFTPPPYLRIKIFDLGKFSQRCLLVKRLMVWETLNFYKGGGVKGESGAFHTLRKPPCIRAFSYQCYPLYCTTPCRSFPGSFLNVQFSSSQQLCTRINSFHMAYLHNVLWFIKINKNITELCENYLPGTLLLPQDSSLDSVILWGFFKQKKRKN